jgi:hypothetical protein
MGIGEPFRIAPQGPVSGYRSFGQRVARRVRATCAEVGCEHWQDGWVTTVLPDSEDEALIEKACAGEVDGIRRLSCGGTLELDGFIRYHFPPETPCFRASTHTVPMAVTMYHRKGDWRGNPDGVNVITVHPSVESWVAEFGEHQQRVADQRQRYGPE